MTNSQIQLLKKCVRAFRMSQHDPEINDLVEVGWINEVNPRTAASLVEAGVLVYDMPYNANECTHSHVRFPTLKELSLDSLS